jgi:NAD(P)-dependent dehydrogenase (short-subunit alcohol dehydrogenase family)
MESAPLVMAADKTVAVVTGASRGAGLGIAHALGSHGCTVYVTGAPVDHADDEQTEALSTGWPVSRADWTSWSTMPRSSAPR